MLSRLARAWWWFAAGIGYGIGEWAMAHLPEARVTRDPQQKIAPRQKLAQVARELKAAGKKVVFTNGCFDLLHVGHVRYLREARALGDVLVVGVNTDASVRRQEKGEGRPINGLADRMDVLAALQAVDYLVPFDQDTPQTMIEAIAPHILVKGEDWRDRGVVGREWVESHGGQVVLVPLRAGCSTTAIIERIIASGVR